MRRSPLDLDSRLSNFLPSEQLGFSYFRPKSACFSNSSYHSRVHHICCCLYLKFLLRHLCPFGNSVCPVISNEQELRQLCVFVLPLVAVTMPARFVRHFSVKVTYFVLQDVAPIELYQKRARRLLVQFAHVVKSIQRSTICIFFRVKSFSCPAKVAT